MRKDPAGGSQIDLHGLSADRAIRRLSQELHARRVRGEELVLVITGRGNRSPGGRPVLLPAVEDWLAGEGRRLGVVGHRRVQRGGALEVRLSRSRA